MYYLNSRYYDPEVGRFVNADEYVSTGQGISGHNMYSYCLNNPVNMLDSTGDWPWYYYANSSSGWPWYYYSNNTPTIQKTSSNLNVDGIWGSLVELGVDCGFDIVEHSLITSERPNNIGVGTYKKSIAMELERSDIVSKQIHSLLDGISDEISYVEIAVEVGTNIQSNTINNRSIGKIAWDATVNKAVLGLNTYVSGAIGA